MSLLAPIKLLPARDRVAAAIREGILTQRLKTGEEITLKNAAQMLGVSVTPVREAFQMLARDGLIELRPNKGAIILGISPKRITDHYRTRAVLERTAIEEVCKNNADISDVENAYKQGNIALKNNNAEQYSNYNQAFHMAIWKASGNEIMCDILSSLWNGLSMGVHDTKTEYAYISNAEHAAILTALKARDVEKSGTLMEQHIERSLKSVLTNYSNVAK